MYGEFALIGFVIFGIGVGVTKAIDNLRKSIESESSKLQTLLTAIGEKLAK